MSGGLSEAHGPANPVARNVANAYPTIDPASMEKHVIPAKAGIQWRAKRAGVLFSLDSGSSPK